MDMFRSCDHLFNYSIVVQIMQHRTPYWNQNSLHLEFTNRYFLAYHHAQPIDIFPTKNSID